MAGDRVRDEAERLVAAALAAVASATRGFATAGATSGGAGLRDTVATGSAECCVCPVCRAIAAMRDPSSDLTDRLTAGVGDLATGVAAILRTLSARGGRADTPEEPSTSEGDEFWEDLRRKAADAARAYVRPSTRDAGETTVDDPWRAATREPSTPEPTAVPKAPAPRKAVTKKMTAPEASPRGARDSRERESPAIASDRVTERTGGAGTRGTVAKKSSVKKVTAPGAAPRGARDSRKRESPAIASDRVTERTGGAETRGTAANQAAPPDGAA